MADKSSDSKPLSAAERQRRRRGILRAEGKYAINVRGKEGYFDEGYRLGQAVKILVDEEKLDEQILEALVDAGVRAIPPKNRIDARYIEKLLREFLGIEN